MDRREHRPPTSWHSVWPPAVFGLLFSALGVGLALLYWHNQATFRAGAVPARAVIDRLYSTTAYPLTSPGGYYYDQYGLIHFQAQGRTEHAHVLLVADCSGDCLPVYSPGQVLTVYYNPQNPTYAQLNRPGPANLVLAIYLIPFFPLFGLVLLVAAAINLVAAIQDHPRVKAPRAPPRPAG